MSEVKVRDEWNDGPAGWSEMVAQARRDDPEYDKAWRDGLQRMADEWDKRALDAVVCATHSPWAQGDVAGE